MDAHLCYLLLPSCHKEKKKKKIKLKAQKTHQSRNQLPASCSIQTLNPSTALLPYHIPSHTAVPKPGASGIFLTIMRSTETSKPLVKP